MSDKGSQNSTNIVAKDITCRGGNGIAFGSLGQYVQFVSLGPLEIVVASHARLAIERHRRPCAHGGSQGGFVDIQAVSLLAGGTDTYQLIRLDPQVQPNLGSGVYFKSWTGTVNGSPPTGGGGGGGYVSNVVVKDVSLDNVTLPIHVYQTNGGHTCVIITV